MKTLIRLAAAAAVGALTITTIATPASAEPPEQWWTDIFNLDEVHQTTQGEGSIVCVIDGAINADVPEFDGADLQLKSASVGGQFGEKLGPAKSYPKAFYADHGTSMSSLIIGQGTGTGPGGSGIAGMAPKATVYFYGANNDLTADNSSVSAFDPLINQELDDGCELFSISFTGISITIPTLERLNEEKAVVLWGGPIDSVSSDPVQKADGTLVIGASDQDSKAWTDDKQPQYPDLVAPGVDIISGGMDGTATDARWDSSIVNSGSSDATAITAGVLALVKAKYPDATGNQLIQSLLHSVGGPDNWAADEATGWGPVNMKDMLARDPSGWPDVNPMLMDRQEIFDTFPESVWTDPDAPATEESDPIEAGPEATTQSETGSVPAWAFVIVGVGVLAASGALLVVARRRTRDTMQERSAKG